MAARRLRTLSIASWLGLLLVACAPEIKTGHFTCEATPDCPADWYCWSDGFCYDAPELGGGDGAVPTDASPGADVVRADARPGDAASDAGDPRDGTVDPRDGTVDPRDALPTDQGFDDAGCVGNTGALCQREGYCGARVSCAGACEGGAQEPACACGPLECQSDGRWSLCVDPSQGGESCSTSEICGGVLDCNGDCVGGNPRPDCACGAAACGQDGQWSACPGPSNYGETCDGSSNCGGTIDCSGTCVGGSPLPRCECGTATCGGCVGGSCGANSQCVQGRCVCTVDDCECSVTEQSCSVCLSNGNVGFCTQDAYSCGSLGEVQQFCAYGCTASPTPQCACHPNTDGYCEVRQCNCQCGSFSLDGIQRCDGTCEPSYYLGCPALCADYCCGPICR